jgi:hypothetical protein
LDEIFKNVAMKVNNLEVPKEKTDVSMVFLQIIYYSWSLQRILAQTVGHIFCKWQLLLQADCYGPFSQYHVSS